jgi:hypothetical protein
VNGPDLDALYAQAVDQVTDDCIRSRFGVEPVVADPSGVLLPSEPIAADADEDAQFAAVMVRYYPGAYGAPR